MIRSYKNFQFHLKDGRIVDIKDKDIIALYPNIAQNDPKYFSESNKFIFDRFVNINSENVHGFLPFGSSKSMCPGRLFAKNGIKYSIIMFFKFVYFDLNHFETIPAENKQRQGIGVSHPENDIHFKFKYKQNL